MNKSHGTNLLMDADIAAIEQKLWKQGPQADADATRLVGFLKAVRTAHEMEIRGLKREVESLRDMLVRRGEFSR